MSKQIPQVDKTENQADEISAEKTPKKMSLRDILGTMSLLGIWAMLIYQLRLTWTLNDQYAHGFLVPLLCFYLALKAIHPDESEMQRVETKKKRAWLFLGIPSLLAFFPLWVIREANSDWRMLNVALFLCVASFTFALAFDQGGFARVKMLAFPILFFVVAIPWPLAMDLQLTQWLQGRVSSLIVDILLLLNHEVRLQGNVIDVGVFGQVGVDEACSGIHGLQASLVVSLFLGSYYRLGIIHRIVFCLTGVVVALALNLSRAFGLALIKTKGIGDPLFTLLGNEAPPLHDLAGWIESIGILVILFILVRLGRGSSIRTTTSNEITSWDNLLVSPPLVVGAGSCLWLILILYLSHLHYEIRERTMEDLPPLVVNFENKEIITANKPISTQIKAQLHYTEARSVEWQERIRARINPFDGTPVINPNAEYWQGFQCSWESGGACTSILSTHSPDACLPLTGLVQIHPLRGTPPEIVTVHIEIYQIPFEAYEFAHGGGSLHVFRCFWPHKSPKGEMPTFPSSGYDFTGRIQAALEGRRNVGGSMLALCVTNVGSREEAIVKFHRQVKQRLTFAPDES